MTQGPGLIGALLVGLSAAKALAWARRLPLVPVDHLHGHVASLYLAAGAGRAAVPVPARERRAHAAARRARPRAASRVLGTTLDDAAGEAFDKGARLLGLGYPGGAAIDRLAREGDPEAFSFPVARVPGLDFSFSGREDGAALRRARARAGRARAAARRPRGELPARDRARARRAAREAAERTGAERIAVVGGVAANSELRAALAGAALAPLALCTDNAAMIASAARYVDRRPVSRLPWARCVCRRLAELAASRRSRSSPRRRALVLAARDQPAARRSPRRARRVAGASSATPRPQVAIGQRMIVVLELAVARRPRRARRRHRDATTRSGAGRAGARGAAAAPLAALASRESASGRSSATRACSTASPRRSTRGAVALLERAPEVAGVYPVRAAYPATISADVLCGRDARPGARHRDLSLPGFDGAGSRSRCSTRASTACSPTCAAASPGLDVVGRRPARRAAARSPSEPTELERHGTQMAGILVGAGGPAGHRGRRARRVRPADPRRRLAAATRAAAARLRAHRPAASPASSARSTRTPTATRTTRRASRCRRRRAVRGFADGPTRAAVAGALALDTLVVAPAGNDGAGRPGFGSSPGPGGSPAALTVGAADLRAHDAATCACRPRRARVAPRPHAAARGAVPRARRSRRELAAARARAGARAVASSTRLLRPTRAQPRRRPRGARPRRRRSPTRRRAQRRPRGRRRGRPLRRDGLPAGGARRLDEASPSRSSRVAGRARARRRSRRSRAAATSPSSLGARARRDRRPPARVAPFSSRGLAFDGRVKPDLVAPGVGARDRRARRRRRRLAGATATVNGSSAAAAAVAGAAALLAQARPALDAPRCAALLVGDARGRLDDEPVTAPGRRAARRRAPPPRPSSASPRDARASARSRRPGWPASRTFVVRNVSTRRLRAARRRAPQAEGAALVARASDASRLVAPAGQSAARRASPRACRRRRVADSPPRARSSLDAVGGAAAARPVGDRVRAAAPDLLGRVELSTDAFRAVDDDAGACSRSARAARPRRRRRRRSARSRGSTSSCSTADGNAPRRCSPALRDLLPGRYAFGLTGRARRQALAPGRYALRVTACAEPAGRREPSPRRRSRFSDRPYTRQRISTRKESSVTTRGRAVSHLRENPFEIAREQLRRVADVVRDRRRTSSTSSGVQEVGRGLDPGADGRRHDARSSRATASRTTSRAARRRAASATTRTSRSTRSRRSRCG